MDLNIAEIFHKSGELQYRYPRYLANDGSKWVRHSLLTAFHRNGERASEGTYVDGLEDGNWRDFHEDGLLAAEGCYEKGVEAGTWRYWNVTALNRKNLQQHLLPTANSRCCALEK